MVRAKKMYRITNSTNYNDSIRDISKVRKLSEFKAYITWRKIVRKTFLNFYKCWNIWTSWRLFKGVSLSRTFTKGTFSQFSLKQKIKTLVKDFSHIFRYIFEVVKKQFSFENKEKSRTYRRSRAASHHGQLILRAWYFPKFSSKTHIYLFFLFRRVFRL